MESVGGFTLRRHVQEGQALFAAQLNVCAVCDQKADAYEISEVGRQVQGCKAVLVVRLSVDVGEDLVGLTVPSCDFLE